MGTLNNFPRALLRNKRAGVLKSVGLTGKRSQGMPMEFIVIAVITVLVLLVLIVIFLQGSSGTSVIDTQTAINTCNSECVFAVQYTKSITQDDLKTTSPSVGFCSKTFQLKGYTATKHCSDIVTCNLIFTDGTGCKAGCNGNYLRC